MEEKTYQNIIAYLDQSLSESERREFEADMQSNPELAREVSLAKEALYAINEPATDTLRSQLRNIMQEEIPAAPAAPRFFTLRRVFALAAALALIAVVYFWIYDGQKGGTLPQTQQTGELSKLVATYFQAPETLIPESAFERVRDTIPDTTPETEQAVATLLETVKNAYGEKNFEAALAALNRIPATDKGLQFYDPSDFFTWQGILLLQLDRSSEALNSFESAEKYRETEIGSWYMIAALLTQNRQDKAKILLKELAETPHHPHSARAKELLEKLP